MPEKWTKRSRPPSSGVMKPKPLSSLNHLTVPVAMYSPSCLLSDTHTPVSVPQGPDQRRKGTRDGQRMGFRSASMQVFAHPTLAGAAAPRRKGSAKLVRDRGDLVR